MPDSHAPRSAEKAQTKCWAWSQDWGRDTHCCIDSKGHDDLHVCKCGARWEGDFRAVPKRSRLARLLRFPAGKTTSGEGGEPS